MTSATPDARWLELCMDTAKASPRLGEFWAAVLGGEHRASADDPAGNVVVDDPPGGGIAMCPVPEPKTVKHRVHLDVLAASIADLQALGATVTLPTEESGFGWTVMADPEGGEFCAFVRERDLLPAYRLKAVGVDCADPERIAHWWAERFGVDPPVGQEEEDGGGFWELRGVTNDPTVTFDFAAVPEPKTVKNRVHWDVYGEVGAFERAGATVLWTMPQWTVMADSEGNEFCVFPPPGA
jgi:hypothetical protein